jgi:hypothetical protein
VNESADVASNTLLADQDFEITVLSPHGTTWCGFFESHGSSYMLGVRSPLMRLPGKMLAQTIHPCNAFSLAQIQPKAYSLQGVLFGQIRNGANG